MCSWFRKVYIFYHPYTLAPPLLCCIHSLKVVAVKSNQENAYTGVLQAAVMAFVSSVCGRTGSVRSLPSFNYV